MHSFKTILAATLTLACIACTALIYMQSEGGGIAMAALSLLVIVSALYGHFRDKAQVNAVDEEVGAGSMAMQRKAALRHARVMSQREDGDIRVHKH
jgi:hypothetical protein